MGVRRARPGAEYLDYLRPRGMTPKHHHRLEVAAVVGIFAVAAAVTLLVLVGIITSTGYVPQ